MKEARTLRSGLPSLKFVPRDHVHVPSRADTFKVGDYVRMQDPMTKLWDSFGTIVDVCDSGRSFLVDINGTVYLRNSNFLKHSVSIEDGFSPVSESDFADSAVEQAPSLLRRSKRIQAQQQV